jgi:DNA polymerase
MPTESPHLIATLNDLRSILENEQRLFGDILLYEEPKMKPVENFCVEKQIVAGEIPFVQKPIVKEMPAKKSQPALEDPLLFDLPETPKSPITSEAWGNATSVEDLNKQICECQKCPLGATRTKFVFGVGNPNATLMFIGEAPGADEDAQGEPFVGRAGQLLTKIIEAINFKRSDVYICNILKCRPPNNRKPTSEESETCKPYLKKQIELVKPKVIVCLGLTAAENLLGTTESMGKLRGRVMKYEGVPVMITYHPAALLRNPNWKRPTWEDVQAVRKLHDELISTPA